MKKVLFTGAYGFLGNNIIPILEENYEIDTLGLSSENKSFKRKARTNRVLRHCTPCWQ